MGSQDSPRLGPAESLTLSYLKPLGWGKGGVWRRQEAEGFPGSPPLADLFPAGFSQCRALGLELTIAGFRLRAQRPSWFGSAISGALGGPLRLSTQPAGPFSGLPRSFVLNARCGESGMNSVSQATSVTSQPPLHFPFVPVSCVTQCLILFCAAGLTASFATTAQLWTWHHVPDMLSLLWTRACWVISGC